MKCWNEIKEEIKKSIETIDDKEALFNALKEIHVPTPKKINGETIYYEDGGELRQVHYTDYNEGDGLVVSGGGFFDKNGVYLGHADPPGPRGTSGVSGYNELKGPGKFRYLPKK